MDSLMTVWVFLIGSIIGVIIGVALSYRTAVSPLHQQIDKLSSPEQTTNILRHYPYPFTNFRYLGSPIDGIQFEEDRILFIHIIKENRPRNPEQEHIKNLIETGAVTWFEFTDV
jgi:hypothetical protein